MLEGFITIVGIDPSSTFTGWSRIYLPKINNDSLPGIYAGFWDVRGSWCFRSMEIEEVKRWEPDYVIIEGKFNTDEPMMQNCINVSDRWQKAFPGACVLSPDEWRTILGMKTRYSQTERGDRIGLKRESYNAAEFFINGILGKEGHERFFKHRYEFKDDEAEAILIALAGVVKLELLKDIGNVFK